MDLKAMMHTHSCGCWHDGRTLRICGPCSLARAEQNRIAREGRARFKESDRKARLDRAMRQSNNYQTASEIREANN